MYTDYRDIAPGSARPRGYLLVLHMINILWLMGAIRDAVSSQALPLWLCWQRAGCACAHTVWLRL